MKASAEIDSLLGVDPGRFESPLVVKQEGHSAVPVDPLGRASPRNQEEELRQPISHLRVLPLAQHPPHAAPDTERPSGEQAQVVSDVLQELVGELGGGPRILDQQLFDTSKRIVHRHLGGGDARRPLR